MKKCCQGTSLKSLLTMLRLLCFGLSPIRQNEEENDISLVRASGDNVSTLW